MWIESPKPRPNRKQRRDKRRAEKLYSSPDSGIWSQLSSLWVLGPVGLLLLAAMLTHLILMISRGQHVWQNLYQQVSTLEGTVATLAVCVGALIYGVIVQRSRSSKKLNRQHGDETSE